MIKIFPKDHLRMNDLDEGHIIKELRDYSSYFNLHETIGDYSFYNSGKDSIRAIIENLRLKREDEVLITTTNDSSYVSTCVSATIFNYCKISRVLTDNTKAIFVIHTFCFPHPTLIELKKIAEERKIPMIEDCISAFDSYNDNNIRLGSVGDFAVYSLPKIFPIEYGGILTSKSKGISGIKDDYLSKKLKLWTPFLHELKKRKRYNYFFLKSKINNPIYKLDEKVNPFMYGFYSKKFENIMNDFGGFVEFGKTHVKNEIHIPVNPFIQVEEYEILINHIGEKS